MESVDELQHGALVRAGDGTGQLYRRNRYYDQLTGRFTQEDPIGLAGLNLYGFANGDPVNFADPFGLCKKYKDGSEDTECRQLVDELTNLGVETASAAKALGVANPFQAAAAIYEKTSREVEFVSRFDSRLNEGGQNSDSDPTTIALGRTMPAQGGPILIRNPMPAGDRAATAVHEALAHGESKYPNQIEDNQALSTDRLVLQLMPAHMPAPLAQLRLRYFKP